MTPLTTVIRELYLDDPGAVLSDAATSPLVATCAALVAGEPRRAVAILDAGVPDHDPETVEGLRYLAAKLDQQWWPGPTATIAEGDLLPPSPAEPATGDAVRDLSLVWVGQVIPQSLDLRSLATGARRAGEQQGRTLTTAVLGKHWACLIRAQELGLALVATHGALVVVDVFRRGGVTDLMATAMGLAEGQAELAGPAGRGACVLARADALMSPLHSPETLGFDLETPGGPRSLPDDDAKDEAARIYAEARRAFVDANAPRGVATVDLRLAWLASLGGRHEDCDRLLSAASSAYAAAGDGAGHALAATHAVINRLHAGDAVASRPGPEAELTSWSSGPGSRSYGIGCARLIHAAACELRDRGELEVAIAGFDLGRRIVRALGDTRSEVVIALDAGELYARLNSRGVTSAILEEALQSTLAPHGGLQSDAEIERLAWMQAANIVVGLFREQIAERDPDGLDRVAVTARRLLTRAPGGPRPVPAPDVDLLAVLAASQDRLTELSRARGGPLAGGPDWSVGEAAATDLTAAHLISDVHMAAVHGPAARALRLAQEGRTQAAEAAFDEALAAADALGASGGSMALAVLAAAGRTNELVARTREFFAGEPAIDSGMAASLWVNAQEFEKAAAVLDAAGRLDVPPALPGWQQDWEGCEQVARIMLGRGLVAEARAAVAEGVARFERRFAVAPGDAFRVALADDAAIRRLYHTAAAAAIADGDDCGALEAADRVRSVALAGLLAEADWSRTDDGAAAMLRAWRQAQAEWTGAYDRRRAAWHGGDQSHLDATANALISSQSALDDAAKALDGASPGTARRRPAPLPPMATGELQEALDAGTLLVEYLLAEDELLVWAVTRTTCRAVATRVDSLSLTGTLHRVHRAWQGGPADDAAHASDVAAVAEALLTPVRSELDGHGRVLFVPFGASHLLAFHALPFGPGLLGDERAVSQLPAASLVPRLAGRSKPRLDAGALVVGDPAFDPSRPLARLPGAAAEASAVARTFGVPSLVGADADEATVRRMIARSPVVHLATHGLLDETAPNLSSIVLAGHDELTVAELVGLGLDIDLAVLSACDSGRGDITLGGDVVGLTRGLLAAGVRHAVVSLWPVDDRMGCLTMTAFAEHLAGEDSVAEALARARRDVRALDEVQRSTRYAGIAAAAKVTSQPAGRRARDARPPDGWTAPGAEHPTWWAPFVHVGV